MKRPRKYLNQGASPYPHMGRLIEKKLKEKKIPNSELARRIDVSDTTIKGYFEQPSLQMGILWKIGIALNHNFFDDMISHFPIKAVTTNEAALQQTLKEKDNEIQDLKKEIALYKGILMRNG